MNQTQDLSKDNSPRSGKRLLWFLVVPVLLAGSAFFGMQTRERETQQLANTTKALDVQPVRVIHAERGKSSSDLTLPGMIQAFSQSPVYARVDGYVRTWYVDIGAHVTKGQLLAEIDAPEVDQQLNQARAILNQAQTSLALAKVTAPRYQELIKTNSVSQQEVDQNNQNLAAQEASVQAAAAAVSRLEQMQGFEKIVAPFDGVITERKTDFGDLVNAGNAGTGRELFRISQNNMVRVFVSVPEEFSSEVKPGTKASMDAISLPNRRFAASVTRTADAIDATSRTLTVELDVPNPSGELLPGAYANVHFQLPLNVVPLVLPSSTILFQTDGPQVGVVNSRSQVELRKVTLGHDFGDTIEIMTGVRSGDAVIANPPDSLTSGMRVAVQSASTTKERS
ncbi:MAG TPA: efflux RND transporter periplasmic adaptor subunit [Candidatus Acidoferrales bacterium]|jgi:RND family efflux transporter MFP subunit|nr:efflux RND transporter periplasmic adaptor subunit [Candidatus Acidoferrales bacterium]